MRCDLMSSTVQRLYLTVIGPFVTNIECSNKWTSVWISTTGIENLFIDLPIQIVYGVIERK